MFWLFIGCEGISNFVLGSLCLINDCVLGGFKLVTGLISNIRDLVLRLLPALLNGFLSVMKLVAGLVC